ncbi:MAG: hypothetical protein KKE86_05485 [Planctomycetes bacterium]|nr:hypothetical protein [Planctomycetota bacterium]MBU4398773.1 hypothetical protein [Planctomycetota bacterium]MCG2682442.1 hypothetical protein [Planctomycetales bacterium]
MSNPTFFVQECPTCGRRLQIRVEYLGRKLVCQHCQGQMIAADPTNLRWDCAESNNVLLHRADELLETVAHRKSELRQYP